MANENHADFTPTIPDSHITPTKAQYVPVGSFKFWAQKVLPTVYDDSLSYYEVLTKLVWQINKMIEDMDNFNQTIDSTLEAYNSTQDYINSVKDTMIATYNQLQEYVNHYFDNLDVQDEINHKLDQMAASGALTSLIAPVVPNIVTNWLAENVKPVGSAVTVDDSLTISGSAADARQTGNIRVACADQIKLLTENECIWSELFNTVNSGSGGTYRTKYIDVTRYLKTNNSYSFVFGVVSGNLDSVFASIEGHKNGTKVFQQLVDKHYYPYKFEFLDTYDTVYIVLRPNMETAIDPNVNVAYFNINIFSGYPLDLNFNLYEFNRDYLEKINKAESNYDYASNVEYRDTLSSASRYVDQGKSENTPFFPNNYGKFEATSAISGLTGVSMNIPNTLTGKPFTFDFWVSELTNMGFRVWLNSGDTNIFLPNITNESLVVGRKWTEQGNVLSIDYKYNNWYHIKLYVPIITPVKIFIGTNNAQENGYFYLSKARVVVGDSVWWNNYASTEPCYDSEYKNKFSTKINYTAKSDYEDVSGSNYNYTIESTTQDMPFYPIPYGRFLATQNISGLVGVGTTIPADVSGKSFTYDFWVSRVRNMYFRVWIMHSNGSSYFPNLNESTLRIGNTYSVDGNTLIIDNIIGDWYHINVKVNELTATKIVIGTNNAQANGFFYLSRARLVLGDSYWWVNYSESTTGTNKLYLRSTQLELHCGKLRFQIRHITDNTINVDCWRLFYGWLYDGKKQYTLWNASDADGVIMLSGESDFIGGYHGDELTTNIVLLVDGQPVTMGQSVNLNFETVDLFITSDLYHSSESEFSGKCFKRCKHLHFENNKMEVNNVWEATENVNVITAFVGMFSIDKAPGGIDNFINGYTVNSDWALKNDSTSSQYNENLTEAYFYTIGGNIKMKIVGCYGGNYQGQVLYYNNGARLKFYGNNIPGNVETGGKFAGGYILEAN